MAQSNKKSAKNLFRQPTPPPSRQLIRYSLIFIAGLLLGWFVLGWWLFPIEYTQVYPNELRDEARDEYFQMVAEGYALTGDRIRAARRLQYWNVDDELQRVINARILALESTDPAAAEPLRRLAEDLHLTQTTALPRTSGQSPTGGSSNLGRSILYLLGGMLVLALLYFLYKQVLQPRMSAPSGETTPLGAALPSGENAKEVAIDGDFELCTSVAILTELARKLDEKFGWEKQKIAQLITSISNVATVFKTTPWLKVVSDDPDNRILECALKAGAEFLVTGDKHLLKLSNYGNFEIIKLSTFLSILHKPSSDF